MELLFRPSTLFKAAVKDLKLASDVPNNCKIYVFYLPALMKDYTDLKEELYKAGVTAENNIFVGIWSMGAPDLTNVLSNFSVNRPPAIVIFAAPEFSSPQDNPKITAYARIDNQTLLADKAKASECINEACSLFLQGKIKQGVSNVKNDQYTASIEHYLQKVSGAISKFLNEHTITFDVTKGQVIIAPTANSSKKG